MNISDPIADMLTRVRNAARESQVEVGMPCSKLKVEIARVLQEEGYILDHRVEDKDNNKKTLKIRLKYVDEKPVISGIKRLSLPSRRVYIGHKEIPRILGGLGIVIMSTPIGVVTGRKARRSHVGGELLCEVW